MADSESISARFSMAGRNVIVTGGGYGLGKAMAMGLASAGARVAVAGRTRERLSETVRQIESAGGRTMYHVFDARDRFSCDEMVHAVASVFGSIEAAVVNHGIMEAAAPHDLSEAAWRSVIDTNLSGCFYCARAIGEQMIRQGNGGSIVLVSSNGSLLAFEGLTAYGASKGGVDMLCRQLASEWGKDGIRVNTLNPGYTTNPMGGKYEIRTTPELEKEVVRRTPLGRRGSPDDLVGPVVFLCSDASCYVSGHSLVVDGGYAIN